MSSKGRKVRVVLPVAALIAATINHAAGVELTPNPNPSGNTITISTPDVESHGEPYETFGAIDVISGGVLANFLEFTILSGTVSIESGGTLTNDAEEGVFVVDEIGSLYNYGTIDNYGRLKNSWAFGNRLGSVFNNYAGATLTNTRGMDQRGELINAGSFLNSVDVFSGDGAGLQNVGDWTNTVDSTFTNLGVADNFGTITNSGFMQNRLGASGGITQGKFENRNTVDNLADGEISNEHRWFNRSGSVINNSGTFTNSIRGLGLSNEGGSTINNEAGGTFQNDRVINNAGEIRNAGTFIINADFSFSSAVQGAGTYSQTSGETMVFSSLEGSQLEFLGGIVSGDGSLVGPVNIGDGATISPGNSAGMMTIDGSLNLNGIFSAEIESLTLFDTVDVTGNTTLGVTSALDIILGDSFIPDSLDAFTILTATTLAGAFGNVSDGARLDTFGGEGSFLVSYDNITNNVVLSNFLPAVQEADYDEDGDVDGNDFLSWQRGESPDPMSAGDLALWEDQFGTTGALSAAIANVPEPTTGAMLLFGVVAMLAGRRTAASKP